jgi:hypothetical protein
MKKILQLVIFAFLTLYLSNGINAQKLDKFTGDLGKKVVMGKDVRAPYTQVISYYSYIKPGCKPDEVRDGKNYFYLYVWIPIAAPELGVRMASPVPIKMAPEKTDFVTQDYTDNKADVTNYFDTWISLERANGIVSVDQILTGAGKASWMNLGTNDDSGEMPAQPSGSNYNSLMRITSDINDPLKSLVIGLYRIGFTTYKVGDVQGSFLAQVGAPIKIPGVVIAKDLESLVKMVNEGKK